MPDRKKGRASKRRVNAIDTREPTRERGERKESAVAGDPTGTAAEQCYKFVVEDSRITGKSDMYISGANECVYMASGVPSDGKAVFVVCCRKRKVGNKEVCKECRADFNLVVVPDPQKPSDPKIRRDGTIFCKMAPAPE